jgi:hypothetical protein
MSSLAVVAATAATVAATAVVDSGYLTRAWAAVAALHTGINMCQT